MKKLVRENIEFKRGGDPKAKIGIGREKEIADLFEEITGNRKDFRDADTSELKDIIVILATSKKRDLLKYVLGEIPGRKIDSETSFVIASQGYREELQIVLDKDYYSNNSLMRIFLSMLDYLTENRIEPSNEHISIIEDLFEIGGLYIDPGAEIKIIAYFDSIKGEEVRKRMKEGWGYIYWLTINLLSLLNSRRVFEIVVENQKDFIDIYYSKKYKEYSWNKNSPFTENLKPEMLEAFLDWGIRPEFNAYWPKSTRIIWKQWPHH